MNLQNYIRDISNFPKEGILFKDITPLLAEPKALRETIRQLADRFKDSGATKILGAEARGFIFGAALACEMGVGFIPVRKPGKLPHKTLTATYKLEYGTDTLCMHADALRAGEKILIIDDVLATGGTIGGILQLTSQVGAEITGIGFLMELSFLNGREKMLGHRVESLITF
ncbi:MAG: adenine phosphoribosyltransferase [Opitutae bacterium]|jgi:adenine phosphoribosyltransferase|nr:adenine phosphoribosyltransferase [Opitutae bacterium]MBT5379504.1 adenine phosphoribosyltransferase [Opitutae bacterium]MBT5691083.1 adenine phosphoribosyltransferase [Opitutae bacterium]MBT6462391.1 adenine phosphoribosyltransferase [Opitutae bacterium]MBT7853137.1 adenine phosphoribosyltransferase [Opitutae bacterium]